MTQMMKYEGLEGSQKNRVLVAVRFRPLRCGGGGGGGCLLPPCLFRRMACQALLLRGCYSTKMQCSSLYTVTKAWLAFDTPASAPCPAPSLAQPPCVAWPPLPRLLALQLVYPGFPAPSVLPSSLASFNPPSIYHPTVAARPPAPVQRQGAESRRPRGVGVQRQRCGHPGRCGHEGARCLHGSSSHCRPLSKLGSNRCRLLLLPGGRLAAGRRHSPAACAGQQPVASVHMLPCRCVCRAAAATGTSQPVVRLPQVKFIYDHVFEPHTDNRSVYKTVASPIVQSALDGINGTVFACGQAWVGGMVTHALG